MKIHFVKFPFEIAALDQTLKNFGRDEMLLFPFPIQFDELLQKSIPLTLKRLKPAIRTFIANLPQMPITNDIFASSTSDGSLDSLQTNNAAVFTLVVRTC